MHLFSGVLGNLIEHYLAAGLGLRHGAGEAGDQEFLEEGDVRNLADQVTQAVDNDASPGDIPTASQLEADALQVSDAPCRVHRALIGCDTLQKHWPSLGEPACDFSHGRDETL